MAAGGPQARQRRPRRTQRAVVVDVHDTPERRVGEERAVPAGLLLDARELYEQWAEAVRARLLVAHRGGARPGPVAA